jgi:hypothetical protein
MVSNQAEGSCKIGNKMTSINDIKKIIDTHGENIRALEKAYSEELKQAIGEFKSTNPQFPVGSFEDSTQSLIEIKIDLLYSDPQYAVKDYEVYEDMASWINFYTDNPSALED